MIKLSLFIIGVYVACGLCIAPVGNPEQCYSPVMPESKDTGTISGIHYTFIMSDTFYAFSGSFYARVDKNCLMDVSYSAKHKKNYNEASDIEVITENKDWYVSRYTIKKYLLLENRSEWITVRDNVKGRIDFRMLCNKSSLGVADVVKSSFGYYQFTPYRQGYRVEYYQECRVMNNHLAKIYLESSKDEILKYFTGYKTYLLKICRSSGGG